MNISSIEFEIFFLYLYHDGNSRAKRRKIIQKLKSFHNIYENLRKDHHDILQK